jgi:DNA-binding NarL/FixJ family response regulator
MRWGFPRREVHELRLLVVDDHETVRRGICSILQSRQDIESCAEASNGRDAIEKASEFKPDLIILDVSLPGLDGFAAAREIKTLLPEVAMLIMSMHDGPTFAGGARRAGAQGFVSKSEAGHVLLEAVAAILQGQTFFPALMGSHDVEDLD